MKRLVLTKLDLFSLMMMLLYLRNKISIYMMSLIICQPSSYPNVHVVTRYTCMYKASGNGPTDLAAVRLMISVCLCTTHQWTDSFIPLKYS